MKQFNTKIYNEHIIKINNYKICITRGYYCVYVGIHDSNKKLSHMNIKFTNGMSHCDLYKMIYEIMNDIISRRNNIVFVENGLLSVIKIDVDLLLDGILEGGLEIIGGQT